MNPVQFGEGCIFSEPGSILLIWRRKRLLASSLNSKTQTVISGLASEIIYKWHVPLPSGKDLVMQPIRGT